MIPTWELSIKNKGEYRRSCYDAISRIGRNLGFLNNNQGVKIRDITPFDLGLESWSVPEQPPGTYSRWIECEPNYNDIIIIYKVVQLSTRPVVNKLAFRSDNELLCAHSLSELYGIIPILERIGDNMDALQAQYGLENLSMDGWLNEPVIFHPHARFMVDTFTDSIKLGHDELVLVGYVLEKEE